MVERRAFFTETYPAAQVYLLQIRREMTDMMIVMIVPRPNNTLFNFPFVKESMLAPTGNPWTVEGRSLALVPIPDKLGLMTKPLLIQVYSLDTLRDTKILVSCD